VTVRADYLQVLETVVVAVAVDVIQLQRYGFAVPFIKSASLAARLFDALRDEALAQVRSPDHDFP